MSSWPNDTVKTVFGFCLITIQFLIPLMVLIICYGKIALVLTRRINKDLMKIECAVNKSEHRSISDPVDNAEIVRRTTDPGKEKFQLARRNTIKTLLIVGICFIICWSQNQVQYLMFNCGFKLDFSSTYHQFTIIMVFLNCTVNPFIYLIKYRDYQEALTFFFHCNDKENRKKWWTNSFTLYSRQSLIWIRPV